MKTNLKYQRNRGFIRISPRAHSDPSIQSLTAHAPSAAAATPQDSKRYHEFDALRGFAMLLGILLHGLLSFTFLPIWPAQDIQQNTTAYGFLQHAIHGFRMPVFYLISGFFTAMMWRKRGAKGLVTHRARRILLPLVIGTLILWPMMLALGHWGTLTKEKRAANLSAIPNTWTAAKKGNLDALQHMIDQGADLNQRDPLGVSPLEWAAMYNHPDAITLLVKAGADVDARNPKGSTALHAAAFVGRTEATRALVGLGADVQAANHRGDTPRMAARVDMTIVHLIAGALQLRINDKTVIAGKRETATYLQGLEMPGSIQPSAMELTQAHAENHSRANGENPINEQSTAPAQSPVWNSLLGMTLAAAFLPVFHHLWFLYYLLWLIALFLVAVWIRRHIPLPTPRWLFAMPWCLTWLVPTTLLPQLFMTQTFGVDTAPGLLPWPPTLFYYAVFFGFGALCFGRVEFEQRAGRHWASLFLAALPVLLAGLHFFSGRGSNPGAHLLASLCAVVYAWLMAFGLIGFFRRFFSRQNPRIRYLSDSAYWLYLAHLPLIIGLQIWVSNWSLHHFPKFILVCSLTILLLILSYEYLVRYTFLGTILNGKRTRPISGGPDRDRGSSNLQ